MSLLVSHRIYDLAGIREGIGIEQEVTDDDIAVGARDVNLIPGESDLLPRHRPARFGDYGIIRLRSLPQHVRAADAMSTVRAHAGPRVGRHATRAQPRSEEHTSELQSLMRSSYAVFCLK